MINFLGSNLIEIIHPELAKKTLHKLMDRIGAKLFERIVEKNDVRHES